MDIIKRNKNTFALVQLAAGLLTALFLWARGMDILGAIAGAAILGITAINYFLLSSGINIGSNDLESEGNTEDVGKLKAEFLANMSHELRTPLNSVIGFSQMLQDQVIGDLNEQQNRYIGYILSSGKNLEQMINDILDLAKIESGRAEIMLEEFLLTEVVVDVISGLNELIDQKNLRFALDVNSDLTLTADKLKLKQVIFNLLSNAVKFTPNEGQVALLGKEVDSGILISVSDTGIGIREDDIGRVFNLFEQGDSSMTKSHHGTGLGLALVKTLVEMHNGSIWAESELGKGSTFSFIIPVVKEQIVKLEA